jgi:intracellular sulfur oxidation DsrE/DsrF family protein
MQFGVFDPNMYRGGMQMILSRRWAVLAAMLPILSPSTLAAASAASKKNKKTHRVAVHVNSKDPASMTLILNNVQNMYDYFTAQGEALEVRIVAHGPGLHMFRDDTSPVKERLASMKSKSSSLSLAACGNTKRNMEKDEGQQLSLLSLAEVVPSGVVELVLLEEQGWSYLRP